MSAFGNFGRLELSLLHMVGCKCLFCDQDVETKCWTTDRLAREGL
jgi:hypothetical protein